MLIFFMNGDPKSSVRMMETKDKNPSPMNSGEPHLRNGNSSQYQSYLQEDRDYGRGLLAKIVGHSSKIPLVGKLWQSFEPPPQFRTPDSPIREAPIIRITVPTEKEGS